MSGEAQGDRRTRVLYVEDSAFLRAMVEERLVAAGFDVVCAEDGAAAWSRLERLAGAFDVILTDIEMPRCNGIELVRRIRQGGDARTPIIALTSLGGHRVLEQCLDAGVTRFLVKFDFDEVSAAIRELAGEAR